jgi:signal transduction histidine kinase
VRVQLHDRLSPRWQLVAVFVLVVLLATLGWFQFRWLGEVSEAERTRMRDGLRARVNEFTQEFDRELTRIYVGFHLESPAFETDTAGALADASARIQSGGGVGDLVKDVFLVETGARADTIQRLDARSKTLAPVAWPEALGAWRRRVKQGVSLGQGAPVPVFPADVIDAAIPALVIPLPNFKRIDAGGRVTFVADAAGVTRAVIVWLDADQLRQRLLEPLVAKYFGAPGASEYVVSIVQRDDPSRVVYASPTGALLDERSADAAAGLFDLRIDEVKRIAAGLGAKAGPARGGSPANTWFANDRVAITIVRRTGGAEGARVLMTGGDRQGAWQVRVRHRSGSLDAIVAQSRRRNLAIGLGVLGLLGASLILILAAAQRQRRLARQQMEFVAAVSHELRTPLAVICSAGENLADGVVADAEQVKRYGSLVETEGRRLGDMVERVLLFAGIGSGARTHARVEVDLARVIAEAVAGIAADARDRGVAVTVHPHGALPPVMGDADALRSAVQNVVGNAVKYSPNGGLVEVTADIVHDAIVRVRVVDHGIGIDTNDLPHVFEPFYRGRRAVDAQVRGTGVGLCVVQHVVLAHGGDVRVESRAGEGTTVTMVLPAAGPSDPAARGEYVVRLRRGAAGMPS